MPAAPYQFFDPLTAEEYAALRADIAARGVQIPVEKDEGGSTLDGHHREQIAAELGVPCPTVVRQFATESDKRIHVIKLNLARRHLDPIRWGRAFARLLEERGVQLGKGGDRKSTATVAVDTVKDVATELGVPERTARHRVAQARQFDALPAKVKRAVEAGKKTPQRAIKEAKAEVQRTPEPVILSVAADEPADDGCCTTGDLQELVARGMKFGTIYADPPWSYSNQATRASTDNHYGTMSLADITALPVAALAADCCHLHLWTTNAFLRAAFDILEAWGFEYQGVFVWVKPQMGMGNCWRVSHEFLITAIKGVPRKFAVHDMMSWGAFDRGEHSAKPEAIRAMLERASPGPRLEMFGRKTAPGWTVFGNQIRRSLFDITEEAA